MARTAGGVREPETSYYDVELSLEPSWKEAPEFFDVTLHDRMRAGEFDAGVARLDLNDKLEGTGRSAASFVADFLEHQSRPLEEGLAFGRWLLGKLTADHGIRKLWEEIDLRREAGRQPLRLVLVLPPAMRPDGQGVADLPFELLADEAGSLFRRPDWVLVRTFKGLPGLRFAVQREHKALLAWANVMLRDGTCVAPELFAAHESLLAEGGGRLGLDVLAPCGNASAPRLAAILEARRPVHLLVVLAHGELAGGVLHLHQEGAPDFRRDPGCTISARDLAGQLRHAGTRVAFLWACHAARRHPALGAVVVALLDPNCGDLAAVVGAHASLGADDTLLLARRLFEALGGVAGGDLECAAARARLAIPESDLRWAALVYYARPIEGRSVWLDQIAAEPGLEAPFGAGKPGDINEAPPLAAHFRGRSQEVADGLKLLRLHRLVSIRGLAGIGKSEVARAVADEAMRDAGLGFQRGLWVGLDGLGKEKARAEDLRMHLALRMGLERCDSNDMLARTVGRQRLLLVLDNAEDLIDADIAGLQQLAETLLRCCPGVRLLFASRRLLGDLSSAREEELVIDRLPEPYDRQAFVAVAGQRLSPAESESPDLIALVGALEGHPRSLCLVAGQVARGLPLRVLRKRIEAHDVDAIAAHELLGEQVKEGDDRLLRAKRLVSSMNLAWDLLESRDPAAAQAFAVLGLLPAGLPTALLRGVFGGDGETRVAALLRHSMAEERREIDRRVTLPAPLRWYAAQRFGDLPPARQLDLIQATATSIAAWLARVYQDVGTPRARSAFGRVERESANLLELLAVAQHQDEVMPLPAAVADALVAATARALPVLQHAGRMATGSALAAAAEALASGRASSSARAMLQQALGDLYVRTDRLKEAEAAYLAALPIYEQIEARLGEANTLTGLGNLHLARQNPAAAFGYYLRGLEIRRDIHDVLGEGGSHGYLARAALAAGRPTRAVVLDAHALAVLRRVDDRFGQTLALADMVQALAASGEGSGAAAALLLLFYLARSIGDPSAGLYGRTLAEIIEGFDAEADPSAAEIAAAQAALDAAVEACAARLEADGEDPLAPMD
ncbi:MAG: tetratricopeptide repeat protein [Myxococcota bacterium]|nr:tetratricopeptide repeat protein [Myxococcota bacterium]